MNRTMVCVMTVAAALLTSPLGANADPLWPVNQTFNASLGVFFLDTDTTVRVDSSDGNHGSEINLEDDFGFRNQDRFRIDGYWRFANRHKLRFMYFESDSNSSRTIHTDIDFGDVTFPIDAVVRADLNIQIVELAYEYSFMKRDTFELSGTIGLHNLHVETGLRANASSDVGAGGIDLESSADGDGPLPVFGLRGIWAFNDHFYLDGQAQFFALEFDNYDGNLQDYKISFNWQPLQHFGLGVGYNLFDARLDVDKDRFVGRLNFKYSGPLLFITGAF